MSTTTFKPADIIAVRNKYTDSLLKPRLTAGQVRTNQKSTDKSAPGKPKVYYIPIDFKDITGTYRPLTLEFAKQLLFAHAKPAQSNEAGVQAKYVNLTFASLNKEDLEKTDYVADQHGDFLKANKDFIEAFDIIVEEYLTEAKKIAEYKGSKDTMPPPKNKTIHCPRQVDREAKDDDEDERNEKGRIDLERPLYRVRLNARQDGTIGAESKTAGRVDTVFDLAKYSMAAAKAKEQGKTAKKVPARLKTSSGEYVQLSVDNVRNFITYMSMVGGKIRFESIIVSSQGISMRVQIQELHVWHHKPRVAEGLSEDSMESMLAVQKSTEDEEPELSDEPPKTVSKAAPKAAARAAPVIQEPDVQDLDDNNAEVDDDADEALNLPDAEPETPKLKGKAPAKAPAGKPKKSAK
jgi:hypothetical protein